MGVLQVFQITQWLSWEYQDQVGNILEILKVHSFYFSMTIICKILRPNSLSAYFEKKNMKKYGQIGTVQSKKKPKIDKLN